jgi:hypothetical protein
MNVLTMLVCCLSLLPGPVAPAASWRWPLDPPPPVLRGFAPPALPWGAGHRGVDLAARSGQPVYAAGAGLISYAARLSGRGVVAILHGGALRTTYLPVRPSVRPGRRVAAGVRIGVVEDLPGHCGGRLCLHWGLLRGPVYLDPLSLVRPVQVRLLPVWGVPPAGHGPPAVARQGRGPYGSGSAAHRPGLPYDSGTAGRGAGLPYDSGRAARGLSHGSPPVEPERSGPGRPSHDLTRSSRDPTPSSGDLAATLAGCSSEIGEAGGGVVAGMLVAFALMLARRRLAVRRRPPDSVIDLARERRRRRCARPG